MALEEFDKAETERVVLDLKSEDLRWLEKYAAYRNALALAQRKRIRKWSRKSIAEMFVAARCEESREQLAELTKQLGELPEPDDGPGLARYAAKALALGKHQRQPR